jgi:DNA-nicking Smr family endonuclease
MHWLEESDLVLAWHSAQPRHGGTGATYVLVRKSSDARQQTRERFSR